ncbi:MAG TPA: BTAD domain-containing putative transcriptional regulator [Aquihabitans sp.]|nr:BTAD domain-containing putative transcriptional regulator [Aquihabitans sp.]
MRLRVLGPIEVVADDGHVAPLAPKARQLLAVLALHAPSAVPVDELTSLLWDDPPPAATKSIQAHVSRLRSALGAAGSIELTGVGYVLRAAPGATDLEALAAHRATARRWLDDSRYDEAAAALAAARALWRGAVEMPDTVAAHGLASRWRREHQALLADHLAAAVEGSHPSDVVSELQEATAAEPLDERRWSLLVRALHRAGDVPGALRAFQSARAALAEIGLEPGEDLRRAEAAALAGSAEAAPAPRPPSTVRYADTGAGRVAYTVIGDGPVATIVLNPGLVSIDGIADQPRLVRAIDRLAQHGAVACLDRRGMGLSDPVPGADPTRPPPIEQWAADVLAVSDTVGTTTVLLASSDTCLAALAVAASRPDRVRGLVLVHGYARYTRGEGYPYGVDVETAQAASDETLDVDDPGAGFDPLSHIAPSVASDLRFRRWFDEVGRRAAGPSVAAALHGAIFTADVRDLLPDVAPPVLLLHRRSCSSVDIGHARHLRDHLPDAELVLLPGADELWFVGDTDGLLTEVEHWLERRELTG